jgi:hypothetical protein
MYLSTEDTRALLSILAGRINRAGYVRAPALSSVDAFMSTFEHFGTSWDVGQIFAASKLSWKKFEAIYKEERADLD